MRKAFCVLCGAAALCVAVVLFIGRSSPPPAEHAAPSTDPSPPGTQRPRESSASPDTTAARRDDRERPLTDRQKEALSEARRLREQADAAMNDAESDKSDKAEQLFLQATEIPRIAFGEESCEYASALKSLGQFYCRVGKPDKSEQLFLQATEIPRSTFGEESREYASALNNLGLFYYRRGEYAKAGPLYRKARDIRKKVLGKAHPDYAASLTNLGYLHMYLGDYAKAEPCFRQSAQIQKEALGETHPHHAATLLGLFELHQRMGERAEAEALILPFVDLQETSLDQLRHSYANSLNALAWLYHDMGEFAKAESRLKEVISLREKVPGESRCLYATSLNNLGLLYQAMGEYAKARPLYREASEIHKNAFGEEHHYYCDSLNNLAGLDFQMGNRAEAARQFGEAFTKRLDIADRVLPGLSEAQAMQFSEVLDPRPDRLLSVLRLQDEVDPAEAYKSVWKSRALVTRMLRERRRLTIDSPEGKKLLTQLESACSKLARLTLAHTKPEQREARRKQLDELNERKEGLEGELGRLSQTFRRRLEIRQAEIKNLMDLLDRETAVVNVIAADQWDPPVKGKPLVARGQYEAFVVRRDDGEPGYRVEWIHLGPAGPIDEHIRRWQDELAGRPAATPTPAIPQRVALRQVVWDKIEPHLDGCSTVLILPEGQMNFVAWNALPGRRPGTCLIEDYTIATAASGQQLYALLSEPRDRGCNALLLVGSPAYDRQPSPVPGSSMQSASAEQAVAARNRPGRRWWRPLPGSQKETEAVERLWKGTARPVVLRGVRAGESAVRDRMVGCSHIHLATHGFFGDDDFRKALQHDTAGERLYVAGCSSKLSRQATVTGRNPLILSSLVLAGANLPAETDSLGLPTGEDGILTAQEIVPLDLRGTQLVVLSACETGLGRADGSEGVMGLARAFHLAGARNVVASLWKVNDTATMALMKLFYDKLWRENKRPIEALRESQLYLMRHPTEIDAIAESGTVHQDRPTTSSGNAKHPTATEGSPTPGSPAATAHPRLWAAWVLSGPGD